jgi:hypothetical protein
MVCGNPGCTGIPTDLRNQLIPWYTYCPLQSNKAKFSITHMTEHYAGLNHCNYPSTVGLSEDRDPMKLMVTGDRSHRGPSSRLCPQERGLLSEMSPSHSITWGQYRRLESILNTASFSPRTLQQTQCLCPAQPCGDLRSVA